MGNPYNPLIVQSDFSLLLEVYNEKFELVRNGLSKFAELIKSPEYMHTYKLSSLSLWNAAAVGNQLEDIIEFLQEYSKFDVPQNVIEEIKIIYKRFGLIEIHKDKNNIRRLILYIKDPNIEKEIISNPKLKKFLLEKIDTQKYSITLLSRGELKVAFFDFNIPVYDIAGYTEGKKVEIGLRDITLANKQFRLRDYDGVRAWRSASRNSGGAT